jgi:lysophospholipase L1-like esterase
VAITIDSAPSVRRQRSRAGPAGWLVLLTFGLTIVVILAVLGEVGLRVNALRYSATADPRRAGSDLAQSGQKGLYIPDSAAGYVMRPNVCVRLRTDEYDEVLRTNSRGLVGPDVSPAKAPGEFRIDVLGDSCAVGGQVPYGQTFPSVLERDLQARGYTDVRVVNAGVGGYSTFNEAGLPRENLDWLQPDLVIVAAFVGNDLAENVLATAFGYSVDPSHPKELTLGSGASELVQQSIGWFARDGPTGPSTEGASPDATTRVKTAARAAWDAARTDSLLLDAMFATPPDPSISTAPGARPPSKDQRKLNMTSFEWTILRDIPHAYWLDRAWPLFGEYLTDVRTTGDSVHAPVLVMVIPQIAQVVPTKRGRTVAEFGENRVDWERPQRELIAQATGAGLPVPDLLPELQALPRQDAVYLPVDQHFTAFGHRLSAELLANTILSSGWLR